MLWARFGEALLSNPLIDRALVKPFDPIACQAAAARSEGQGRPDACRALPTLIAPQFVASRSGRRSLALDGSEHGGRIFARRDGGVYAAIRRGVTMVCACVMLLPSASAVYAKPLSHGKGPALSNAKTSSVDPWSTHIREAAIRFAIPERLLRAVMRVESVGDVHALSSKGAMGLMQIMPATWEELRIKHHLGDDPYQPRDNILAGAAYLREMLDRFGRNGFLAAYNAGPGRYEEYLATGRPLPLETIDYVRKLAPMINGSVPIPKRGRQGAGKASVLEAVIFAQVESTANGSSSRDERETDGHVETVFSAIRSPRQRAPMGKAVTDLTALVPPVDASRSEGAMDPNPTVLGPFVHSSSGPSQ
ncbi:lytic transglycosylase domain-containing protein [Mesorhizobium sp. BR1-1-3]|uniref:lytic transglycosylase domain-containing protein n=1 Tax=Mesorhizobium sp. BR1-1-3 TaxID=2876651 RepID=UPI001CD191C0|nr:lytic transglycosylase domain-containing protein [Mesorhizobium sp. BR1-1-3]MBZ9887335.1 lytic transglycosylase domain-containing protein [Mesorhizobium sp. BR1-1-3]